MNDTANVTEGRDEQIEFSTFLESTPPSTFAQIARLASMNRLDHWVLNTLPKPADEPLSYFADKLANRASYNAVLSLHPQFIAAMSRKDMEAVSEILSQMRSAITRAEERRDVRTLQSLLPDLRDDYEAHRFGRSTGVPFGYKFVDRLTGGMQDGDIILIVGRPGVGKTYTLLNFATRAWRAGYSPMIISMEMMQLQMARRVVGIMTGLNPDQIRKGTLDSRKGAYFEHLKAVGDQVIRLKPCTFVAGNFMKSVGDIDMLIQEFVPDIVYVDAGYLLTPEKQSRNGSRHEEVAAIAEELKQVALRRSVPIVLTVQFNRDESGAKDDRIPLLANIAGSDVLGQVASLVIAVRKGAAPNDETERRYDIIKDRDGVIGGFTTEYVFSPSLSFKLIKKTSAGDDNRDHKP